MGLYSRFLFPCLCDFVLDRPFLQQHRRELLSLARGNILEIGFGTGLNLPCYPEHVRKITTVDPNQGMHRRARKRIAQSQIEVDQHVVRGERLPFANESFDCVVSTLTLCSIDGVHEALSEIHRVLKPGGRFLFLEHGLSPEPNVQKWQQRLNWLEIQLAGGCRLNRNIRDIIERQPFSKVELNEFYIEKFPRTHAHISRGTALK